MSENDPVAPHKGLDPRQKRELLLRLLQHGKATAGARSAVDGLDFSETDLSKVDLIGANLAGIKLAFSDLTRVNFTAACLDGADLSNTRLVNAILVGASMRDTKLQSAFLQNAELGGAHLVRTNMLYSTITNASFTEAYLWGARLEGAYGTPDDCRAAHIDAETYRRSRWTPAHLTSWLRAGALIEKFGDLPEDAQLAVYRDFEGLLLFVSTRLLPWDQTALHAAVCTLLGFGTDVRIAEYIESSNGQSCRIRLIGSNVDELIRVAEYITSVSWRTEQAAIRQAAGLLDIEQIRTSLDYIRSHVDKLELWARDKRNSEGAAEDANLILRQTWGSDVMRAGTELLEAVGVNGIVRAGAALAEHARATITEAKDARDVARWEAAVARQELEEDDD